MVAKREKKLPEKVKIDGWVATFGDLISLMLTFFVLIVSMSTLDDLTLKDVSSSFSTGAISLFDNASNTDIDLLSPQDQPELPLRELLLAARQKSNRVLQNSVWQHKVKALVVDNKFILRMPNSVLFHDGLAELKPQDIEILKRLARLLASTRGGVRIEGHTSSETLPAGSPFSDAWNLSLARAASVLHVVETEGVSRSRLSLVGYGPSRPISTNVTPHGRSKNQRVDIVLYELNAKTSAQDP